MRSTLLALAFIQVVFLLVLIPVEPAPAVTINNGLAPPNPANVIADATYSAEEVIVRNVGNTLAGAPTTVVIGAGASIEGFVVRDSSTGRMIAGTIDPFSFGNNNAEAYDQSRLEFSGGLTGNVAAHDDSIARFSGGSAAHHSWADGNGTLIMSGTAYIDGGLTALDSGHVILSGGDVDNEIEARDSALASWYGGDAGIVSAQGTGIVSIYGGDFRVDGLLVPYGLLSAQTGELTGTLFTGETINVTFYHDGFSFTPGGFAYTGSIFLPEPSSPLLLGAGVVLLTWQARRRIHSVGWSDTERSVSR